MIKGTNYRINILTPSLVRLEYSKKDIFVDEKSQIVVNRDFPKVEYEQWYNDGILNIKTSRLHLIYDQKEFSSTGLKIYVSSSYGDGTSSSVWHYGDQVDDLKGTYRTLDGIDGSVELESGIISRNGFTVLDDSKTVLIDYDQEISESQNLFKYREDDDGIDIYFFGYANNYLDAIKDFYTLTGKQALLPKYALGNWWSRYYKYTDESYLALMDQFEKEQIPLTVAVLDMDWHITEVDSKYGTGWTGYTWNREYFKNPKLFLEELHQRGMKVTLNVHPADGIRGFEESYNELATYLDLDKSKEEPALFNITDPKFVKGYFDYVHHPLEEDGTDFWWIDWQQGTNSGSKNIDPLWLLNHLHYKDNSRNNKRGLILSRYAGPGSHRYPVGFSGDTIVTWESLDFQPYFTSTASNIGYSHWSHDIGGHMNGYKDDELFIRWVQLGVFSPILRLHSTCNEFNTKEPWKYSLLAFNTIKEFLRLRHQLIPYIYTQCLQAHLENIPLIRPMYYDYPNHEEAYLVKNEFFFGNQLLVCPMTSPIDSKIGLSKFSAWLPEGEWIDFYTGIKYTGGRNIDFYRNVESLPVLLKAGTILPIDYNFTSNSIQSPNHLILHIAPNKNGEFTLWEDEHEYSEFSNEDWAQTKYILERREDELTLIIKSVIGNTGAVPNIRKYDLVVYGIQKAELCVESKYASCDEYEINYDEERASLLIKNLKVDSRADMIIKLTNIKSAKDRTIEIAFDILMNAQIEYDLKTRIMNIIKKLESGIDKRLIIGEIATIQMNEVLRGALIELLTA